MIVRIVKLILNQEVVEEFKTFFDRMAPQIRSFEGCQYLELLQDINQPNIVFTYSYWEDQNALDKYRYSDFFRGFWSEAKTKFDGKPEAWSNHKIAVLE
ncbi:MAG: antibiotic biosynthesis monooxygenase [Chitinophagales bacterium]|nr:antibiotic biosynthesis monooxygenase [Chitinophagales bacterium]